MGHRLDRRLPYRLGIGANDEEERMDIALIEAVERAAKVLDAAGEVMGASLGSARSSRR